ncbi:hypothetical protein ILYODFUR_031741 [Ilyodon furcidens]|uniref:Immunoglobulin V-set domain-containing protein n=1 Tax=Ilyodon furcidens TaxID=33524 RepID=A0ABV0SQS4_9TELE
MTSNTTNIFLNIKPLHVNDSGLYLCGFYAESFPAVFTATHLQVEVHHSDETGGSVNLLNWILGGIVIFLALVIIGFVVKIRTFYTVRKTAQHNENVDSCTLNYAALSFPPKGKIIRRPAAQGEMELNVMYAATR